MRSAGACWWMDAAKQCQAARVTVSPMPREGSLQGGFQWSIAATASAAKSSKEVKMHTHLGLF